MPPVPNLQDILNCNPVISKNCPVSRSGSAPVISNLGGFVSSLLEVIFMLTFFLAFFWLVWGAFQYIFAGGNKENLAKARSRITWAIVGLLLVSIAFLVAQWTSQILQPKGGVPL